MQTSFLLNENENLNNFFNKDSDFVPVAEFMYIHSHPLIRPNFLTEITDKSTEAMEIILDRGIKGKTIEDLERVGVILGENILDVTEEKAKTIMLVLRDLYKLSNTIIKTYSNDPKSY